MLLLRYLLLLWLGAVVVSERVIVNRRARQRIPRVEVVGRSGEMERPLY